MNQYKKGKDLTKEPPRSPKVTLGGYVIISRTIDKCRTLLWGKLGEYEFDCALDRMFLNFKGITGDELKSFVNEGHSDEEIIAWIKTKGTPRDDASIAKWSKERMTYNYSDNPENKEWLEGENKILGLPKDGTLFDYLEADDKASFKK